ncbi:hypothetical protein [Halovenus marina]|uniref:hypothetical protein n=1 Tax=Halovenus marina TaxID=3396621 RepID=UPI003F56BAD2
MPPNCPTASVKGSGGWEWNRLQAARDARRSSTDPSSGRTDTRRSPPHSQTDCHERVRSLKAEIRELEAELARRKCERQTMIERYERLLAEKNRKLESQASGESTETMLSALLPDVFER